MRKPVRISLAASLLALAPLVWSGCGPSAKSRRYSRAQAQESLARLESPGLVIGEFQLAPKAVIDGDTLKVVGLDTSLRLLAIDTEETFKRDADRRASDADFGEYLKDKRGDSTKPVKAATPLGEDAKKFAKEFFSGVSRVRLERDHPKEVRGRYNRYLAYAFAERNGEWVNYNVEAVRAGMTPYFTKYGYSRRFHNDFIEAEKEAKEKQIGIWKPGCECYPDYPERKTWWDRRAEFILDFERKADGRDDHIVLTNWDSLRRIEAKLGKEITVLATVGEVRFGDSGPSRVMLSRRMFNDLPAVFFDRDVFLSSGVIQQKGEFVAITGVVNKYKNKYNNKEVLQILVNLPSQVKGSKPDEGQPPAPPILEGDSPASAETSAQASAPQPSSTPQ